MSAVRTPAPAPADALAPAPPPRPALLRDSARLAGRHLRLMSRRPASLMGAIVLPLVFAFLFFTVFGNVIEKRTGLDYAQYLLPAVVMQAILFAGLSASILAVEDRTGGVIRRLRAMAVARLAPVLGLVGAELCRVLVALTVLLAVGVPVGFRFRGGVPAAVGFVLLALLFATVVCTGYAALGLGVGRLETVQVLGGAVYYPLLLLSNAFVPAEAFPDWLQPVVAHQPFSVVADALRALADDGPLPVGTLLSAGGWLAGGLLLFSALAVRAFGRAR